MKTVLVTGGCGFIGSAFVLDVMRTKECQVVNVDKLTYAANPASLHAISADPLYIFEQGDICDRPLMAASFEKYRPQTIVHFAAESHVDRSIDDPGSFIQTNLVGTFNLLECARHYWKGLPEAEKHGFRFLHVSTDEVFGTLNAMDPAFCETTAYAPNSPYAASKAGSDHLVRAYYHTYGLPVVTTNCSNNYGPRQFPEKLIPLMITKALKDEPLPVYGDGLQRRDWLYVHDHIDAIRTVIARGALGDTYNVGGNCEMANLDLVKMLITLLDEYQPRPSGKPRTDLIKFVTDRPGHDRRYAMDIRKIGRELDWRPRETFVSGLRKTIEWYLGNRPWMEAIELGRYEGQRLGVNK